VDPHRRAIPSRQLELPLKIERAFAGHTEQLTRLQGSADAIHRHVDAVRKRQAADTETLNLVLRKVTQIGHDLHLREPAAPPLRPTRQRPLG